MLETYFFELEYYNEYKEEDLTVYGAIGAESYGEAMELISTRFSNIGTITIRQARCYDGFVFFDTKEELKKAYRDDDYNGDYDADDSTGQEESEEG